MNKAYRQGQILSLIRSRTIYTQEELARELKSVGVPATQVTLSRDVRELGLVKTAQGYRQIRPETGGPPLSTIAAEFLWEIRAAQNLIVLKTSPAHASSLAAALDRQQWPEIVGTVAGDDTVLVVTPDNDAADALRKRLLPFISP
ncbi:MAG: ArgR family transcriptional regulator [Bryobacteraceae bacterium]|nr:ArgR family transcriptional regulator [Bryobacteraceae bacterium]HEU0140234.1 ArgR family transcriptional regulator [Bryobacteraceae bacterium]